MFWRVKKFRPGTIFLVTLFLSRLTWDEITVGCVVFQLVVENLDIVSMAFDFLIEICGLKVPSVFTVIWLERDPILAEAVLEICKGGDYIYMPALEDLAIEEGSITVSQHEVEEEAGEAYDMGVEYWGGYPGIGTVIYVRMLEKFSGVVCILVDWFDIMWQVDYEDSEDSEEVAFKMFIFWVKILSLTLLTIWARAVGPRFRPDQLSDVT